MNHCKLCDQPVTCRVWKNPYHPDVKSEVKTGYCEAHQTARDEAARLLGLTEDYESELYRIPLVQISIKRNALDTWKERHRHRLRTAIGGGITKTEGYTSIGTLESWYCSQCREEAFIDDDF